MSCLHERALVSLAACTACALAISCRQDRGQRADAAAGGDNELGDVATDAGSLSGEHCRPIIFPAVDRLYPTSTDGTALGDVMTYYDLESKRQVIFYLRDVWDDGVNLRHPWAAIASRDFVSFERVGGGDLLVNSSDPCAQDFALGTGSVVSFEGELHAFYTGHNPNAPSGCAPRREGLMFARAPRLGERFVPEPGMPTLYPPTGEGYDETNNFRDPSVFRDPDSGLFYMSVAARKEVAGVFRGVVISYLSRDLVAWTKPEVIYDGGDTNFFMLETPQRSRIGDWYYLTFSDIDSKRVLYRKSRTPTGPWQEPDGLQRFEGTGIYAAKVTLNEEGERFVLGWTHALEGRVDTGAASWAGNLVTHKANQLPNGDLSVSMPPQVRSFLESRSLPAGAPELRGGVRVEPEQGRYLFQSNELAFVEFSPVHEPRYLLSAVFEFEPGAIDFGLTLGGACDGSENLYTLRLIPAENLLRFDRRRRGEIESDNRGESDVPFDLHPDVPYKIEVIIEGSMLVAYVDDRVALSMRAYQVSNTGWALFSRGGTVRAREVTVHAPP